LHGDLPQALAYNPLFVVALPFLAFGMYLTIHQAWTGRRLPVRSMPVWFVYAIVCVILAYWVLRNVPVYPWTLLAPHVL
jgi:TRAP-type C4-dicarboxylate transport system permease small subunit